MKDTYLDVKAKDESGKSYIIEMQVLNVEGFEQRILYNACKAYAGQLDSGEAYIHWPMWLLVIAITITDFVMFKELIDVVNSFKLRADNDHVYHDDLEYREIFIQDQRGALSLAKKQGLQEFWTFLRW